MSERLPTGMLVNALLRRVNDAGGIGAVLAKGDAQAGAILLIVSERDADPRILERRLDLDGAATLSESGPQIPAQATEITQYWRRRRERDPDLWVVELHIAGAERFAAETIL
ncbi:MAG: DUF1491 family protein [Sphingomonas sp.]